MANKRVGSPSTVLHVLAKQGNDIFPWKIRNNQFICEPDCAAAFHQSSVKFCILVGYKFMIVAAKFAKPPQIKNSVMAVFHPAAPIEKSVGRAPCAEERVLGCGNGALEAGIAASEHRRNDGTRLRFYCLCY
jgi:hypothetical protein